MTNYTTINHEARTKLGLTWLEYGLADLIYNLANNPKSIFPGWCYASKENLAKQLGVTKQTVHTILNKLEKLGLIVRETETKHIKVTIDWYKTVVIKTDSKETLPMVKKVYSKSKETLLPPSKETLHNIYITNKDINNVVTKVTKKTSFGNPDINDVIAYLKEKLELPRLDLSEKVNRQYAHTLLKRSKTGSVGVKWLIDLAAKDGWHKSHITSFKDLWNNQVKILSGARKEASKYVDATNVL